MRLLAILVVRAAPLLLAVAAVVFLFDVGGTQQPMLDAYSGLAGRFAAWLGEGLRDALTPTPLPSPGA